MRVSVGAGRWACGSGVDAELSAAWERGRGMGRCVSRGGAEGKNGSGPGEWEREGRLTAEGGGVDRAGWLRTRPARGVLG